MNKQQNESREKRGKELRVEKKRKRMEKIKQRKWIELENLNNIIAHWTHSMQIKMENNAANQQSVIRLKFIALHSNIHTLTYIHKYTF